MDERSPVVIAARRTPVATAGRGLARVDAAGLAGPVLTALLDELTPVTGSREPVVDEVVLGNCCGPGGDIARVAALAGGLGVEVPGVSVDRQCGSGLEAIRLAGTLVTAGHAELVLAGGVESASTAPWRLSRPSNPTEAPKAYSRAPFAPAGFADPEMGDAAEAVAAWCRVSRHRQDLYAARSHRLAVQARDAGHYAEELVAVAGMTQDDRPRSGLSVQTLARFRPAFSPDGTVTAGNSCGINDGAAAVTVVSERLRAAAGLPGLRLLGSAVVGVDPATPGLGPVPAVRAVLDRAGLTPADLDVFEIIEAFAAQVLACTDLLGLDPLGADDDRVCPQGGTIALGHPWGASGALLLVRLFAQLVRRDPVRQGFGVAACAIGGGQGIAVLVQRVG